MKKEKKDLYVIMGKIGAPYGVHGWLKIYPYAEISNLFDYSPWYLHDKEETWTIIEVENYRQLNKQMIAKFKGVNTPEDAKKRTNKLIWVRRDQLPTLLKNEFYWSDLVGLTVIDQKGNVLGKVTQLIETGSNDVLLVKGNEEIAIPYLPGTVIKLVDLEIGIIEVNWDLV